MKALKQVRVSAALFVAVLLLVYGISASAWMYLLYVNLTLPFAQKLLVSATLQYDYPPLSLVLARYPVAHMKDDVYVYFTPPIAVHVLLYFAGTVPVEVLVKNVTALFRGAGELKLVTATTSLPQLLLPTEEGTVGPLVVTVVLHPDAYSPADFRLIYSEYVKSILGASSAVVDLRIYVVAKAGVFGMYREVGRLIEFNIPARILFNAEKVEKDYGHFKSMVPYLPYTVYPNAIYVPKNESMYMHYTNLTVVNVYNKTIGVAYTTTAFVEAWNGKTLIARRPVGGGKANVTLAAKETKNIIVPTALDPNLLLSAYNTYKGAGFNVTVYFLDIYTVRYDGTGFVAFYKKMHEERYPYP